LLTTFFLSIELNAPSGGNSAARILILSYPSLAFFAFATLVQHIEQAMRALIGDFSLGNTPEAAE
jgi:hypothetical protein